MVRFHNIDTKKKYCDLSFGKKLSLNFENEVVNISITHDKTKKQREESKARYESMARTRNNQSDTGAGTGAVNNGVSISNFQNHLKAATNDEYLSTIGNLIDISCSQLLMVDARLC